MIISTACCITLGSGGPAVLGLSARSPTPKADEDPGSVTQPSWLHLTLLLPLQDRLLIREKRWGGWRERFGVSREMRDLKELLKKWKTPREDDWKRA